MKIEDLNLLLNKSQPLDRSMLQVLRAAVDNYPYFQVGIFGYLKCLYITDDELFQTELRRLSTFINDRKALFYFILSDQFDKFFAKKGEQSHDNRTDVLLNAFFEILDDNIIEDQLEHSLTHSSMASLDYFSYINMTEESLDENDDKPRPKMKHQGIIDDFINNAGERSRIEFKLEDINEVESSDLPEPILEEQPTELDDDLFFTETLAQIYIKQKKYTRAYEIIKRLNLNYPEKNIYFANQLSFLEKLIINSKNKI